MLTLASAAAGFGFARAVRRRQRQLTALIGALDYCKNEILYRFTPLPELFSGLAKGEEPAVAAFFEACAAKMEASCSASPQAVIREAMQQTPGLEWSAQTRETLQDLAFSLGRFDVEGQGRAIDLAQTRLQRELEEIRAGSRSRCRSYETLGICAGLALAVILL